MKGRALAFDSVSSAEPSVRAQFIHNTYLHLAGAILLFIIVEYLIFNSSFKPYLVSLMLGSPYSWLIVLGVFMGVGYFADKWAHSPGSPGKQYLGLGVYIVAEAVIFLPLLYIASTVSSPDIIQNAAILTLLLFSGLTFVVFTTKKDFSFLGSILKIAFPIALGAIVLSILFGFTLGLLFSVVMVVLASGAILYTTSNILREYHPSQHVAASLALFASVALLFWYILQILMALGRDD